MSRYLAFLAVATLALVSFLGFQGKTSKTPPVMVFDDMDYQAKYKPQGRTRSSPTAAMPARQSSVPLPAAMASRR